MVVMDYTDYIWLKAGVILFAAAIYGFWKGFHGEDLDD